MNPSIQTENYSLRQQLETLLGEARLNEEKMRRLDLLERQLIGAHSLAELISLLLNDYRQAFGIELVSLTLVDREYEAARILEDAKAEHGATNASEITAFPGLIFIQSPTLLAEVYQGTSLPMLARFIPQQHARLFHTSTQHITSVALLPLIRHNELIGSLHLGSSNPARYTADSGTTFLERLANIIAICLDTTLAQERLKRAGLTDGLTGVQNRRYFDHRYPAEVSQARRHQQPLACMFLDIDKFKRINDTYGHQSGDEVLRGVAKTIQGQLRTSDTISRYGGEEFVVLLPQTPGNYALEIAERIRQAIAAQPFSSSDHRKIQVTISIGLSMLTQQDSHGDLNSLAKKLLNNADKAVYQAKNNGRNQVVSDWEQRPRNNSTGDWRKPASWLSGAITLLGKLLHETGFDKIPLARTPRA